MSSDRIDPDLHAIHADPSSPEEPYPFTTNGAPSDDIVEEVISWVVLLAGGTAIPIGRLNALVYENADDLCPLLHSIDITDADVVSAILSYLKARRVGDRASCLIATKLLVTNE